MYRGTLTEMLKETDCIAVYIDENITNLIILLYADDIALCADSVGRL